MARIYTNFKALLPHSFQGHAVLIPNCIAEAPRYIIKDTDIPQEIEKLQTAFNTVISEFQKLHILERDKDLKELITFQIKVLQGSRYTRGITKLIQQAGLNAEAAIEDHTNEVVATYSTLEDPYLSERSQDFKLIGLKLLSVLNKYNSRIPEQIPVNSVIIANELGPIEMMQLIKLSPVAIIAGHCGQYSHTAIIASGANIPILISPIDFNQRLESNSLLAYDSFTNRLLVNPTQKELDKLETAQNEDLTGVILPPFLYKNQNVTISANIEPPENPELIYDSKAQGFGLIRTEFLFFQSKTLPTEQEQYDALEKIARTIAPQDVITIRSPDFGGDKTPLYNPIFDQYRGVLALRGIGLTLKYQEFLIPHLRAVLRLYKKYPNIRILLPMVKEVKHLTETKEILTQLLENLKSEKKIPQKATIPPIGAMIEVPAAAICADLLAPHCDFFSIGGNDLVQFTMAADRNDITQEDYFIECPEAVLRLIQKTIDAATNHLFPPSICADLRNKQLLQKLLELGIRHFSTAMHNVQILAGLLHEINIENLGNKVVNIR